MIWTREQAKALTDRALSFSKAEETQVILTGGDRANVRFARNSVTTAGASSGYSLAMSAKFGKKTGTVTASEFSDASLQRAARNAEEIARLSPDNPEAMPLLGPQTYTPIKAYFDDAATATPEWRAGAVRTALDFEQGEGRRLGRVRRDLGADPGGRDVEGTVRLRPVHAPPTTTSRRARRTAPDRAGRRSRSTSCGCSIRRSSRPRPSTRRRDRTIPPRSSRANTPWSSSRRRWPI